MKASSPSFDVIVIGGGHAGCEAAAAAARMGARVALVSFDRTKIGAMSCNPAIGGLGKGHLVREVDAFDGLIGKAADAGAIHYRMLNRSKGSAVQGPRVQADRKRFKAAIQTMLAELADLHVVEGEASALILNHHNSVEGVTLADGRALRAPSVVLATGTFLGGKLFRGEERLDGGRIGEASAHILAAQLRGAGLPMRRLKTGTPPRIDGRTINWVALERQESDADPWTMSVSTIARPLPQLFCAITRTNAWTHDIIRSGLDRSPLFGGAIQGQGPRYCPSIEDKIFRFGDRDGHQVFLEPEGLDDHLVYPNGISTSLPSDIQLAMVRSMTGLERAEITIPGYAVEYDHLDPRCLTRGLMVQAMPGLFAAGQINGTTGYEEAAAQGLVAGINAARLAAGATPVILDRADSYIGVMIDDLTLQGVTEPYRMLTARAEYRLRLRANNAVTRLGGLALELGLLGKERRIWTQRRFAQRSELMGALDHVAGSEALIQAGLDVKRDGQKQRLWDWLRYPDLTLAGIAPLVPAADMLASASPDLLAEIEEDAVYAPYVERQLAEQRDQAANAMIALPGDLDYSSIAGLSNEMVERLDVARPATLAEAGRINGVTPAALAAILVAVKRARREVLA